MGSLKAETAAPAPAPAPAVPRMHSWLVGVAVTVLRTFCKINPLPPHPPHAVAHVETVFVAEDNRGRRAARAVPEVHGLRRRLGGRAPRHLVVPKLEEGSLVLVVDLFDRIDVGVAPEGTLEVGFHRDVLIGTRRQLHQSARPARGALRLRKRLGRRRRRLLGRRGGNKERGILQVDHRIPAGLDRVRDVDNIEQALLGEPGRRDLVKAVLIQHEVAVLPVGALEGKPEPVSALDWEGDGRVVGPRRGQRVGRGVHAHAGALATDRVRREPGPGRDGRLKLDQVGVGTVGRPNRVPDHGVVEPPLTRGEQARWVIQEPVAAECEVANFENVEGRGCQL
mmetsp:Transcript_40932/g.94313  ORF Transcript_40932/g.94313 Transcript_40932/m.94313 type:complete len:338 (-) Transcript_40932:113-1126(-)